MQAQTREISLSTGSYAVALRYRSNICTQVCSGPVWSDIDTHNRIFFSLLVILWYLLSDKDFKKATFSSVVTGQCWSGSLH